MTRTSLIIAVLFFLMCSDAVAGKKLVLAVNSRYWYPFTYTVDRQVRGMHADMAKKVLSSVGYDCEIVSLPRKRCLLSVKQGLVDGMISVVYHESLEGILTFPKDAGTAAESQWRLMQVDHVIASYSTTYEYDGNIRTIPQPVRLPVSDVLRFDFLQAGMRIDEAKTDEQSMKKMMRDQTGVVITTSVLAESMNENPKFMGKFKIQATPLASQSYHIAFSKKSGLTEKQMTLVWEAVKKWREDYVYMLQLFSHY